MFNGLEQKEKIPVYLSRDQIEWLQKNIPEEKKEEPVLSPVLREPILVEIDKEIINIISRRAEKEVLSVDMTVENILKQGLKLYTNRIKKI